MYNTFILKSKCIIQILKMIEKLKLLYGVDNQEEIEDKINEIIDVVNKASIKPVSEKSVEAWFKANEKRIVDVIKNNPSPYPIIDIMRHEVGNLTIKTSNIDEIIRRCNIIIEKFKENSK